MRATVFTRRTVLAGLAPFCGCGGEAIVRQRAAEPEGRHAGGRLTAKILNAAQEQLPPGLHRIPVKSGRPARLFIPPNEGGPLPMMIFLHGAGGTADHGIDTFRGKATAEKFVLLSPASKEHTWDALLGHYGPDAAMLDDVLSYTLDRVSITERALAIAGFSDGASYALSFGLLNGDRFPHVIAFSPGFIVPGTFHGQPRVFISHGRHDEILPIDRCSRVLVPRLRKLNYEIDYREFDGPHVVPDSIRQDAIDWWLRPAEQRGTR